MLALAVLAGCSTTGSGDGKPSLTASAFGGSSGGKAAATIIEQLAGGLIGGTVGAGLSERDKRAALEAEYRALEYTPSGQSVAWRGAGSSGEAVAAQPYRVGSQDCRQYEQKVTTGSGQTRSARGTACRNADGSWTPLT